MPPSEALLATAVILAVILIIVGLLVANAHHVLNQVVGITVFIGFLVWCVLI